MWILLQADDVLRCRFDPRIAAESSGRLWRLVGFVCLCGLAYGTVMGSFGGFAADRVWQVIYSATKVPLLLLGTFILCLPSFFVLNTVAGLRSDFGAVLRALLAAQAGMTIVLC